MPAKSAVNNARGEKGVSLAGGAIVGHHQGGEEGAT